MRLNLAQLSALDPFDPIELCHESDDAILTQKLSSIDELQSRTLTSSCG